MFQTLFLSASFAVLQMSDVISAARQINICQLQQSWDRHFLRQELLEMAGFMPARFWACYMLQRTDVDCPGRRIYIGYTHNPTRRLRCHNGEITGGPASTAAMRPLQFVVIIYGFATQQQATRFERVWQSPRRYSAPVRHAVSRLTHRQRSGVSGKLRILAIMLNLPEWARLPLTVHFLNEDIHAISEACYPSLPPNVIQVVGPWTGFP
eukprot:TRINITY_DN7754_c0_g4_i1.p1 TRINITY_DN7754_c0_g4~~TRINITY_DN7754_c0_g4_i1.p1  ORF type:complete len:209 (+),score=1.85 TRINITY_DN7754_c0_g4_i1:353-979(+)